MSIDLSNIDISQDPLVIKLKEKSESGLLDIYSVLGPTVFFEPNTDSFYLRDNHNFLKTHEETKTIIKGLIKFYFQLVSEEEIDNHNKENHKKIFGDVSENKTKKVDKTKDKVKRKNKPGYVYFIQEKATYTIKIGKATSVPDRSKIFAVKLPFEWDFISIYKAECMDNLEKDLHKYFDKKRVNGEWFDLNEKDLEKIKSNSFPKKIKENVEKIF